MARPNITPLFPLAWKNEPMEIMIYYIKYINPIEARIVRILDKFEITKSHTLIKLWLEGGDSFDEYLSKPFVTWCFSRVSLG